MPHVPKSRVIPVGEDAVVVFYQPDEVPHHILLYPHYQNRTAFRKRRTMIYFSTWPSVPPIEFVHFNALPPVSGLKPFF